MEYELSHHGVKGQKWGVRRFQNKDGTLTKAGQKRYDKELAKVREEEKRLKNAEATKKKIDRLEARKAAIEKKKHENDPEEPKTKEQKKSPKKMSEPELKERIARLKLEKECKDLEKSTTSRGEAFVRDVLETAGKNIATQLTAYVMGTAVNKIAESIGVKNGTVTETTAEGAKVVKEVFEDIVNPRKGQKDK